MNNYNIERLSMVFDGVKRLEDNLFILVYWSQVYTSIVGQSGVIVTPRCILTPYMDLIPCKYIKVIFALFIFTL